MQVEAENSLSIQALCEQALEINQRLSEELQRVRFYRNVKPLTTKELQEWLLAYRKRTGFSLRKVAALSGTSSSTLCRIENGKAFDWETGQAVLRWLCMESEGKEA